MTTPRDRADRLGDLVTRLEAVCHADGDPDPARVAAALRPILDAAAGWLVELDVPEPTPEGGRG